VETTTTASALSKRVRSMLAVTVVWDIGQRRAQLDQLQDLDEQIEAIAVATSLFGVGIRIYDAPSDASLFGRKPLRSAAVASVLALIAAGAWAWWREGNNSEVADKNAPALTLAVAESLDIARQADGVVVVIRPGTSMQQLVDAADRIAMTDRPILG
jgi:hypothetical protein